MGFWDVAKRVFQGKPAFVAPASDDDWDSDAPTIEYAEERAAKRQAAPSAGLIDEKGYKHPPEVVLTNVKDQLSDDHLDLWITIRNQSDREVRCDKLTLLGTTYRMNYPLAGGEQRVFHAYSGKKLTHDHYKKAELYYKDQPSGDYFRADHLVQYRYDSDGTYEVVDFDLIQPIYDV